jgi:hypothetical protein
MAASFVQVDGVTILGVEGIGGDHDVGEIEPIQQWRESGDLVAFVIDLHLAHHDPAGVLERREQVTCRAVRNAGTARGLALDRDCAQRLVCLCALAGRTFAQPRRDSGVQRVRVDGLQDSTKRRLTRWAPADSEPDPHRNRQVMSPFRDSHVTARSGQDRAHRRGQDPHQLVT